MPKLRRAHEILLQKRQVKCKFAIRMLKKLCAKFFVVRSLVRTSRGRLGTILDTLTPVAFTDQEMQGSPAANTDIDLCHSPRLRL